MNAIIGLLSALFNVLFWVIFFAVLAIVYLCRWLKRRTEQESVTQLYRLSKKEHLGNEEEEMNDGSEECLYGYPEERQFCINCDLVEQCKGWSPRNKSEENDTQSDFFTFDHILDSPGQYEEKNPYDHDSLNCDDCWCECHERDGYSRFDGNGEDNDACW
jgi:hypothetical protein